MPLFPTPSTPSANDVDQVLLMGPFVDVEHPSIKDGSLDVTFEQVFREQVRGYLWCAAGLLATGEGSLGVSRRTNARAELIVSALFLTSFIAR